MPQGSPFFEESMEDVLGVSIPTSYAKKVPRRQYLQYREMLRRANLELKKFTGTKGFLFRLKNYGQKAPNVHAILDSPIGVEDVHGLGQKYWGGFFPPLSMLVAYSDAPSNQPQKMPNQEIGLSEVTATSFSTLPFPIVKVGDIWADRVTSARFIVQQVDTVTFNGMNVKQVAGISRLPVSDPSYKLEIPSDV